VIRIILFDLVGVLLFQREDYSPDETVEAIDKLIGRVTDDARFRNEVFQRFHLSSVEFDQLLRRVVDKYAVFLPIWGLLPDLRKQYRLGIINNGTYFTYPAFDDRYNLGKNFDLFVSSAQEGIRKPDARIYRLACERLEVNPAECLFMDDSMSNTREADRLGMQTVHWPNQQVGFQRFLEWLESRT